MFNTREEWLQGGKGHVDHLFEGTAATVCDVRISVGFPAGKRGGKNNEAIGQCHYAAADGVPQIFIHPKLTDPVQILGVLAHELAHAYLPAGTGHKGDFVKVAKAIGLEGKMTATTESEAFKTDAAEILETLGEYPHAALDYSGATGRKQTTRQRKAECNECGLIFRTTAKWMEAVPDMRCPDPDCEGWMLTE